MSARGSTARPGRQRGEKLRGVSTTETMAVLAIAGVLLAVGAPAMAELLATQRLRSAAADLRDSLSQARSEAIRRASPVAMPLPAGDFAGGWEMRSGSVSVLGATGGSEVSANPVRPSTITYAHDGRLATPGRIALLLAASGNPRVVPRCIVIDLNGRPTIGLDSNRDGDCGND